MKTAWLKGLKGEAREKRKQEVLGWNLLFVITILLIGNINKWQSMSTTKYLRMCWS